MTTSKEELLNKLSECVLEMEDEEVVDVAEEYIEAGYPALDGIMEGLVDGMNKASELFEEEEYFVTDILLCSDAMYAGLEVLRPYLPDEEEQAAKPIAVIGVVEGDTHDIGKNLVVLMLRNYGFPVIDLGKDVPADVIVDAAIENDAKVIGLSALMTTTMMKMVDVVELVKEKNLDIKVVIGGAVITESFAEEIHADGYSEDAAECVQVVKRLLDIE